jgi:hypothetical protein
MSTSLRTRLANGTADRNVFEAQYSSAITPNGVPYDFKNEKTAYGKLCYDRAPKIHQMDAADLCTAICGWKRDNQRTISSRAKPEFPT